MASTLTPSAPRTRIDEIDHDSIAVSVVEAIARVEDEDPTDIDIELTAAIDPDALDALYAHSSGRSDATWTLRFSLDEYDVTVRSDGTVEVR